VRIRRIVGVDRDVDDHSNRHQHIRDVGPCEVNLSLQSQFDGQRQFDFAGELRVAALFDLLNRVPERLPVIYPPGCSGRCDDFSVHDAALGAKVMCDAATLIGENRAGAICGRCDDPPAVFTGDYLCMEVIDRHPEGILRSNGRLITPRNRCDCPVTRDCMSRHADEWVAGDRRGRFCTKAPPEAIGRFPQ
jgi:hypothetical protein